MALRKRGSSRFSTDLLWLHWLLAFGAEGAKLGGSEGLKFVDGQVFCSELQERKEYSF